MFENKCYSAHQFLPPLPTSQPPQHSLQQVIVHEPHPTQPMNAPKAPFEMTEVTDQPESLIARELRELREREEELRAVYLERGVHLTVSSPDDVTESDGLHSNQNHNAIHLESPIEREIRLAQERENELRQVKGLPVASNYDNNFVIANDLPSILPASSDDKTSRKKFASSRLEHELLREKQRELDLQGQGRITTTSVNDDEKRNYKDIVRDDIKIAAPIGTKTVPVNVKQEHYTPLAAENHVTPVAEAKPPLQKRNSRVEMQNALIEKKKAQAEKRRALAEKRNSVSSTPGFIRHSAEEQADKNPFESAIQREMRELHVREVELR